MRIAIVGATGRIGSRLTRTLLADGHQVKALSRGGPALDALVALGVEPFLGSADTGGGDLKTFFADIDAAFLMVKTDWNDLHGHYAEVGLRFFDALRVSPVRRAVSLTAMGSHIPGSTGHFQPFYQLDQILNRLENVDLVHLQASWFMENLFAWIDPIRRYGRIAWSLQPDVRAPWVATDDIAGVAARTLTEPDDRHRATIELGANYTMRDIAAIIGASICEADEYRYVDRTRAAVEAEFRRRFGTLEKWLDESQTLDAINDGRVRFDDKGPRLPTDMATFAETVFGPRYREAVAAGEDSPETFTTWSAGPGAAPDRPGGSDGIAPR